ncbi:MAG: hypothetical protein HC875_19175 [Anaerolineales bacterium]|nr:hypothetical protein [Anaerolineales bacterium]
MKTLNEEEMKRMEEAAKALMSVKTKSDKIWMIEELGPIDLDDENDRERLRAYWKKLGGLK